MKYMTMTELKNSIGAVRHEIVKHGESYILTYQGKPVARLSPIENVTVIHSDGSVTGKPPLTFRQRL